MCKLFALATIKKNKQIQSDWEQTDDNSVSYIKNKPANLAYKADVEELRSDLESSIQNANNKFATKTSVEGLNTIVQENKSTITTTKADLDATNSRLEKVEGNVANNKNAITNALNIISKVDGKVGTLQADVDALHTYNGDVVPDPAESIVGQLFYNTTFGMFAIFNGAEWLDFNGQHLGFHRGGDVDRPDYLNDTNDVGYYFFDTDMGMPIYWKGSLWVNANGEEV